GWWRGGVSLPRASGSSHSRRGGARGALGHGEPAAGAYRLALRLDPPYPLAGLVRDGLRRLDPKTRAGAFEAIVPLEEARGVWIVGVLLNGSRPARVFHGPGSGVTPPSPAPRRSPRPGPGPPGGA